MQIEKRLEPKAPSLTTGLIPRIIHQTFETTEIADGMHTAAMSWVAHNPDFTYRFHDNQDRRAFIAANFGPEVVAVYDQIEHGAFRADLWRYCQLYVEGGIYADIDSVCQSVMSDLIRPEDEFIVARAGNLDFALFNGFICARPGHPFLKRAIDRSVTLIARQGQPFDGYMLTGPGNLGKAVNLCLGRPEKDGYDFGDQTASGFTFRILEKRRVDGQPPYVTDGKTILLFTDYDGYRDDLKTQGLSHWQDGRRRAGVFARLKRRVKRVLRRLL